MLRTCDVPTRKERAIEQVSMALVRLDRVPADQYESPGKEKRKAWEAELQLMGIVNSAR